MMLRSLRNHLGHLVVEAGSRVDIEHKRVAPRVKRNVQSHEQVAPPELVPRVGDLAPGRDVELLEPFALRVLPQLLVLYDPPDGVDDAEHGIHDRLFERHEAHLAYARPVLLDELVPERLKGLYEL
eukprot:CAMPEP_0172061884 /NCGR_PEP_ID=MMETSP1043-20130122/8734_1 /TAXON_ID=464988 /ORGANISM="Hemiselmis andersenii, Strain CCMP441" /LENGTH=125 /DNA_ID=CAMNT_0012721743 /DNA_START=73 /DNA_END=450 /DNA_ORIENTATION=-